VPREVWSVEIQADITAALSQLQALRAQISGLGAGAAAIRPTFDASGVQRGVNTMSNSLAQGRQRATGFISGLQQDFGSFGRIFASRIAFAFATAVQRSSSGRCRSFQRRSPGRSRPGPHSRMLSVVLRLLLPEVSVTLKGRCLSLARPPEKSVLIPHSQRSKSQLRCSSLCRLVCRL